MGANVARRTPRLQRDLLALPCALLAELASDFGAARADQLGGLEITGQHFVGARIGRALCHRTRERADAVHVVTLSRLAVGRHHAGADPDHAVLLRQREQIVQRRGLVAIRRRRVGEAGGDLVFSDLRKPGLARCVGELPELSRDAAQAGGRTKEGCIGGGERGPLRFGEVASGVDGDKLALRALGHGLGHAFGVAVAAVKNDGDAGHGDPLQADRWENCQCKSNTSTSASLALSIESSASFSICKASPPCSACPFTVTLPRTMCT